MVRRRGLLVWMSLPKVRMTCWAFTGFDWVICVTSSLALSFEALLTDLLRGARRTGDCVNMGVRSCRRLGDAGLPSRPITTGVVMRGRPVCARLPASHSGHDRSKLDSGGGLSRKLLIYGANP